jgi:hypothetical protein
MPLSDASLFGLATNPEIAARSAAVILGMRRPLEVERSSNIDLPLGVIADPEEIPTDCALALVYARIEKKIARLDSERIRFMVKLNLSVNIYGLIRLL